MLRGMTAERWWQGRFRNGSQAGSQRHPQAPSSATAAREPVHCTSASRKLHHMAARRPERPLPPSLRHLPPFRPQPPAPRNKPLTGRRVAGVKHEVLAPVVPDVGLGRTKRVAVHLSNPDAIALAGRRVARVLVGLAAGGTERAAQPRASTGSVLVRTAAAAAGVWTVAPEQRPRAAATRPAAARASRRQVRVPRWAPSPASRPPFSPLARAPPSRCGL